MAAKLGHKLLVTILLANGAELNSQDHYVVYPEGLQGSTPLIEATAGDFTKIMQQLISKGADVNKIDQLSPTQKNTYMKTALMLAAEKNNLDYVKTLIENGADVNIGRDNKCAEKSTALDFADADPRNVIAVYEYLQEKGALHKLPSDGSDCFLDIRR